MAKKFNIVIRERTASSAVSVLISVRKKCLFKKWDIVPFQSI